MSTSGAVSKIVWYAIVTSMFTVLTAMNSPLVKDVVFEYMDVAKVVIHDYVHVLSSLDLLDRNIEWSCCFGVLVTDNDCFVGGEALTSSVCVCLYEHSHSHTIIESMCIFQLL